MHRSAPFPADEEQRLATLGEYALLDRPGEALFDAFAALAAQACDAPIGLIVLLDRERQWFLANCGLEGVRETARDVAFCAYAIIEGDITEIPDASCDPRFEHNPFVVGDPYARFYAGVPLAVANGQRLGTLCVLDRRVRGLSADQRAALSALAAEVVEAFEIRRARLRLLERAGAEFFSIELPSERVRLFNPTMRRALGYGSADAASIPLGAVLPEFAAAGLAPALAALRAGDAVAPARMWVHGRSGAAFRSDIWLERVGRPGVESILGLAVGATDAAAGESIELLSAALDALSEATLIVASADRAGADGTVVYANAALLHLVRARAEDVIGQSVERFFGARTDRAAIAHLRAELARGHDVIGSFVAYRRDGSDFHCETSARLLPAASGTGVHAVYVMRDISDAVVRGASLELLNEQLTTLTEVARNVFASLDPRALVETIVRGVTQLSGGGTAQVLARAANGAFYPTRDLSPADEAPIADDAYVLEAARHDEALVSPDGRRAGVPVFAPAGVVSHVIDIHAGAQPFAATDAFAFGLLGQYLTVAMRNAELYAELASRRAAVIELNQVKNDLIAMLAHDFKGPLTTIVGLAEVLAEDERFDSESLSLLGMINSSAMRLASLASDTLALSRLEQNELSLRFDRVDLVALLRDIVRVFSVTRGIDMRVGAEVMNVRADAARLRQLFENLIGNAIKYSPRGQAVDVTLREKPNGVEVAIRDRGIGIPAADLSKLFGRFARGSNARELGIGGTGFGLYLSRTIIEMHGGHISIDSKEGVGSTFSVFVPAVPAPQRTLDRRILLLEGEEDGRSFIAHTLRDDGYVVSAVRDEDALLAALAEGRYDAAIVDVDRLSIGADELFERIDHRTTLVRLVSTVEGEGTVWNAALRKPFLIKDLQQLLEAAVAERRRQPREADNPGT